MLLIRCLKVKITRFTIRLLLFQFLHNQTNQINDIGDQILNGLQVLHYLQKANDQFNCLIALLSPTAQLVKKNIRKVADRKIVIICPN